MSIPNYSASQEQVDWIEKKFFDREAIAMSDYAMTFDYFTKERRGKRYFESLDKTFHCEHAEDECLQQIRDMEMY
jgi:CO dehydrogenase/acetyl-CoA synthase alpha subunit